MITTAILFLAMQTPVWVGGPSLPHPVTNNAVAALRTPSGAYVYSFLGLDNTKIWSGVTNEAYEWKVGASSWTRLPSIPGPGRLAGTAQAVGRRVYVFGGYTVAPDGTERSVPNVDVWDPETRSWSRAADMPVPVDDAVSGVWQDSLVFLVSGWHDTDNVSNVQVFDPAANEWKQATPIPGVPVFGHTGGISHNAIVFIDGAKRNTGQPRYTLENQAWRGDIDPTEPTSITWRRITHPESPALYRSAALGVGSWIVFAGGTDNPYNYNGIGYDGQPSLPTDKVFAYDVVRNSWQSLPRLSSGTMDHRGLVRLGEHLYLVGGMAANQTVSDLVFAAPVNRLISPN